jgi:UDPglucose--hexose-1-phosphate uridylyltransferase
VFNLEEHPHRRFNPLLREWILVSPHRTQRPWQGQVEAAPSADRPSYDPTCYLCPGNERAGGVRNPAYAATFVFDNDFPAMLSDTPQGSFEVDGLLTARSERGLCRVMCFSPRHDLTLATMAGGELRAVVDAWAAEYDALAARPFIRHVQIFENRGAMMGASNPHPHCQIWASESIPDEPAREEASLRAWRAERGGCLLCEYLALERLEGTRIVFENEHFTVLVPFWAIWPFETMVLPRRHLGRLPELGRDEREALGDALKQTTSRYDRLFATSFPYSMGFHQAPVDRATGDEWHLHAHFYPPLLRSATVRKFMVGFEMLGSPQRDITAEAAAGRLREMAG